MNNGIMELYMRRYIMLKKYLFQLTQYIYNSPNYDQNCSNSWDLSNALINVDA